MYVIAGNQPAIALSSKNLAKRKSRNAARPQQRAAMRRFLPWLQLSQNSSEPR